MVRNLIIAVALGTILLACGCSAKNDAGAMSGDSEEWRLRTLEEKALQFQNAQMELASRVNALESRVKDLEAAPRMGEEDLAPREVQPEPLMSSDDLPTPGPVTMPEEKAPKASDWDKYPDASAATAATASTAANAASSAPKAADMDKAPKAEPKPKPKKAAPAKMAKASAAKAIAGKAGYDKALKQILGDQEEAGRKGMEVYLAAHPKGELAPNAQYWLGESWYHQKRYAEAIVAFKQVHQGFPKHDKAAAALLKIGYSYAALGDTTNAKFYLEVLTEDYPKSEPASLARARLKKLK